MTVADATLAVFTLFNSLRFLAYVPQIIKAIKDQSGAEAISFGTWALFLASHLSAMAYAIVYCIHTLEMNALRGWGVAFLAFVASSTGLAGEALSPTVVVTVLALLGTTASVLGNEAAIRFGRRRLVGTADPRPHRSHCRSRAHP